MFNPTNLNDQKLYQICKSYGEQAKKWRYKFMGLLPEVNKRKLYEKKGFSSIFEFAKKLAGLSEEQVRTALNLDKNFEDKPLLKNMLVNREVSINKLIRITSVVTKENEEFWANQVKILPNRALETLVRDEKLNRDSTKELEEFKDENALQKGIFDDQELHVQLASSPKSSDDHHAEFKLSENIAAILAQLKFSIEPLKKLLELQQKGIDINQLLIEFLNKREEDIEREKEEIVQAMNVEQKSTGKQMKELASVNTQAPTTTNQVSRYIPIKTRKLISQEHGTKCSIKTCQKPAQQIHHTQRFAFAHTHDPRYLAPMCKEHHTIAHSIDLKFQKKRMTAFD